MILKMLTANQAVGANVMAPRADILAQFVDSMLADEEGQELEQELPEVQLPIDQVFDELEETIHT